MIAGATLVSRIGRVFKRVYRERPKGPIADWAKVNILLSTEESADAPGAYDPDFNPLPTILFEAYQSGKYDRAVFKKSSQSGVTLAVLVLICWYVTFEVRNFLYILDSLKEMRDVCSVRLKPMLLACKAASGRIPEDEDKLSNLILKLVGCIGYLGSANSLAVLSNKSVGLAIYDEADGYKAIKASGEKATDLGKERGKAQRNFFEVILGKPIDWDDTVNQEFLSGTQHKCFLPCPHCGEFQELEWEQLKFNHCRDGKGKWQMERLESEVFYECKFKASDECRAEKGKIYERHKASMIRDRDWRQTQFEQSDDEGQIFDPRVFSCEITDMYSMRKRSRWHDLVKEWIEAQGDPSAIQNFLRGRLARPKKSKKIEVVTSDIHRMTKPYERGHCPVEPHVVIMASDVQQSPPVKKWVKAAFRLDDDSCHVVDWGENLAFSDLQPEAEKKVIVDQWDRFTPVSQRVDPDCRVGLIDERHDPDNVRNFVVSTLQGHSADGQPVYKFYSVRGWGGMHTRRMKSIVTPLIGEKSNASHAGHPLWVYDLDDDSFKDRLYNNRINRFVEILAARNENRPPPNDVPALYFPGKLEAQFVSELCQEKFRRDPRTGEWGWERPKGANDFGDALKYCLVGWYLLKPQIAMERAMSNVALAR